MNDSGGAAVASGHPLVSKAAVEIMRLGGNAFDAVVAAGFVGSVAEPALTSLGGGGFLIARTDRGESTLFDFFSNTPGSGLAAQQLEPHFFPVTVKFSGSDQDFNIGLGSIAVPGNLKGFLHVHEHLGILPVAEVLRPAITAARHGVTINHQQAYFLELLYPILTLTKKGRSIYAPGGKYLSANDIYYNHQLADFLENVPNGSAESFYNGEHAEHIAADMVNGQGLLTGTDLSSYKVIERHPLEISYRDHTLLTNPPPSFGGSLIAASFKLLERFIFKDTGWQSPDQMMILAAIMEEIDRHRDEIFTRNGTDQFLWRNKATKNLHRRFSRGTTHISVRDASGNVAAMTTSNGEGSGYFTPGTGIMLNNMMGEDDLHPDGFHASPPGLRVASMMSPTLILKDGNVEFILGSGGSKRIRTAIFQVLNHVIDFKTTIADAVNAPRIHWDGETLQIEPGLKKEVVAVLEKNWPINLWPEKNVYFGGVHALSTTSGAGDPRRNGDYLRI